MPFKYNNVFAACWKGYVYWKVVDGAIAAQCPVSGGFKGALTNSLLTIAHNIK